jgi:peptidoglycan/xylan/chitin deacetylase (PgdA/CDA1 family)
MYHKVGAPVSSRSDRFLNVPPESFARQMRALARLGYRAVPFARAVAHVRGEIVLPRRSFSITFDDAYQCVYESASPTLRDLNFPATLFVVTGFAGTSNEWDRAEHLPVLPLMGWDTLRELQSRGWEIAAHTHTHPHMDVSDDALVLRELAECRRQLAERLGAPAATFCYPYGHYHAGSAELVRQAGFSGACTTRSGVARPGGNPYLIPRVKVAYGDGVGGLLYRMFVRPHLPDMRKNRRG